MKRRRVKLGLYGLTVADILPYCRGIIQKMGANPFFPIADNPHNGKLILAIDELEAAEIAAANGGKVLTATLRQKKETVFNVMRPYRDFVNEKANGSEEILLTTGFALADMPSPVGDLSIPSNVRTKTMENPGEVEVSCNKVKGALAYQLRHRPVATNNAGEVDNPWTIEDPKGALRQVVDMLKSAMYHEFQMRAIGSEKPSSWSGSVNGLAR